MAQKTSKRIKKWIQLKVFSILAFVFIRVLYATYRFQYIGEEYKKEAIAMHPRGSFAYAAFHEHSFGCILSQAYQKIALLVSASFDGEITAFIGRKFGLTAVRGSSTRGGKSAREAYVPLAKDGYRIAITVDGPKGPRHSVKPGIGVIPQRNSLAVLPIAAEADRQWVLYKSWDKLKIPKPFAKVYVRYGKPFMVEETAKGEAFDSILQGVGEKLLNLRKLVRADATGTLPIPNEPAKASK